MQKHEKINYLEYPATDLAATQQFFETVFSWQFESYGPEYTAFAEPGLDGGFYKSELSSNMEKGAALTVFYSDDIQGTQAKVEAAGGKINKAIFEFPGGRRFHFIEPSGNEFAVWGE